MSQSSELTSPAGTPTNLADATPGPFITPKGDPFKLLKTGMVEADGLSPTSDGHEATMSKVASGESEQPPWWTLTTPDPTPMAWSHPFIPAPTQAEGAAQLRLPLSQSPLPASGVEAKENDARKITKEMIWEMCTPFFEQMVDAVQTAVQTKLQASSQVPLTPSTEATADSSSSSSREGYSSLEGAPNKNTTQEVVKQQARETLEKMLEKTSPEPPRQRVCSWADASEGANRRPMMRKMKSVEFRLASEPIQEEVGHAASPLCASPATAPDTIKAVSPASPQKPISPASLGCSVSQDRGGSKSPVPQKAIHRTTKAPSNSGAKTPGVEKGEVVCCHWKNKGWCKYLNQGGCKFAHPEHKRGVGQMDKVGKKFGMTLEPPCTMMQKEGQWPVFAAQGWPAIAMNSRTMMQQHCQAVSPMGMPTMSPMTAYSPDAFMVTTLMAPGAMVCSPAMADQKTQ